ncbi:hypothetical protein ACFFTN_01200 [Aminobacter aganoensis]|uniref:Phage tail sheath gpL-like n=1 Tax=Aminobacter aganoensis TaxID=83264 RepID=A0A7X0F5I3_9HYPH|nr:hypothetical protein [Aminobacter aganoensis]MBB6353526.1 phage tail sheath gpL-like [Aminobacter aganoensis]
MANEIEDGGPAFAALAASPMGDVHHQEGMSLRDWFAGQFLAGAATDSGALDVSVAADQYDIDVALGEYWAKVARAAYIAADAMLKARKRP